MTATIDPKSRMYLRGKERVEEFCKVNNLKCPAIVTERDWMFDACAYYRPEQISICLKKCASPTSEGQVRNWSWPGSTSDREPYGVLCHELGHHVDWTVSEKKGRYFGNYGMEMKEKVDEPSITSYCPNPSEWFAEMFRLFVTNAALLMVLRPATYKELIQRFKAVSLADWRKELARFGEVPPRILANLEKKVRDA